MSTTETGTCAECEQSIGPGSERDRCSFDGDHCTRCAMDKLVEGGYAERPMSAGVRGVTDSENPDTCAECQRPISVDPDEGTGERERSRFFDELCLGCGLDELIP